jgi:predicted transcriptional regulator
MSMQRVQMLLEPEQRKKLAALARAQGKSIAEITRQAIDAGLEKLAQDEQQVRMKAALKAAQQLRDSMPRLSVDAVTDLHQIREEHDNDLFSGS